MELQRAAVRVAGHYGDSRHLLRLPDRAELVGCSHGLASTAPRNDDTLSRRQTSVRGAEVEILPLHGAPLGKPRTASLRHSGQPGVPDLAYPRRCRRDHLTSMRWHQRLVLPAAGGVFAHPLQGSATSPALRHVETDRPPAATWLCALPMPGRPRALQLTTFIYTPHHAWPHIGATALLQQLRTRALTCGFVWRPRQDSNLRPTD